MNEPTDSNPDVLLVCMPFGPVFGPSIGLSLLKASLHRQRISCSIEYFSIRFAELIGQHTYCGIETGERPPVVDLAGDWIFARALAATDVDDEYIERILRRHGGGNPGVPASTVSDATIGRVLAARAAVEPFLAGCVDEIVAAKPKVLGCSSVFQQPVASLALARRIREALPDTFIVLGGANCEGVMGAETVRQFPFVDAVVSGEAEVVFPELVRRVLAGASLADVTGVRTRHSIAREFGDRTPAGLLTVTGIWDSPSRSASTSPRVRSPRVCSRDSRGRPYTGWRVDQNRRPPSSLQVRRCQIFDGHRWVSARTQRRARSGMRPAAFSER